MVPGGNNDFNGKNGELGNSFTNDMDSKQHIEEELMGADDESRKIIKVVY